MMPSTTTMDTIAYRKFAINLLVALGNCRSRLGIHFSAQPADHPRCDPARLCIHCKNLFYRFWMPVRRFIKYCLNCIWNAVKWDNPFEECRDGNLIRGIQGDCLGASGLSRFIGQPQTRELIQVGRAEIEPFKLQHREAEVRLDPVRVSQRIK